MGDVGVPGFAEYTFVEAFCGVVGAGEKFHVGFGVEFPVDAQEWFEDGVDFDPVSGEAAG